MPNGRPLNLSVLVRVVLQSLTGLQHRERTRSRAVSACTHTKRHAAARPGEPTRKVESNFGLPIYESAPRRSQAMLGCGGPRRAHSSDAEEACRMAMNARAGRLGITTVRWGAVETHAGVCSAVAQPESSTGTVNAPVEVLRLRERERLRLSRRL